jgi:hypothetical protein
MCRILIIAVAMLTGLAVPAFPQGQPAPSIQRVKLRALLAEGYELRSVVVVPQDAASRVAGRPDVDAVFISLQKGKELATCYYRLDNYLEGKVLDTEWCVPHK